MRRSEILGRIAAVLACLLAVLIPGWIYISDRAGILRARMAENGGWTPQVIQDGKFPKLSGFEFAEFPNMPENSESLVGVLAMGGVYAAASRNGSR